MATVTLLNLAPSHLYFPSSTASAFLWRSTINMHVTRPKSAKGRTRPRCNYSQGVEACPCRVPPSPAAAASHQAPNSHRASATKPAFLGSRLSPEEISELLRQVPLRTSSSSLSKYRVLPSIGQKDTVEAVAEQTDRLKVSEEREEAPTSKTRPGDQGSGSVLSEGDVPSEQSSHIQCPPEKPGRKMRQESPSMLTLRLQEPLKEESRLLLAVRSPSGQRFEHHFKPTDSLQTVLAVAEQKTAAKYKCCSLETMEVPRRSFSDLTRSLQECGILHKSLVCIRWKEQPHADL
ncbi:UBX10 protein, partial [Urocolius indicus]|nr:UBX10 protein [Urocolius indicus]